MVRVVLPWYSRVLIAFSQFMASYWWAVFIAAGLVIYLTTNSVPGLIVSVLLGAVTMVLILAQAGAFSRPNDRA